MIGAMVNYVILALLLSLSATFLPVQNELIASIDCGASGRYTDENFIPWTGDADFMQMGHAEAVPSANANAQLALAMRTLRAFTTSNDAPWKKYCYSIYIGGMDSARILVRASFYYGNYDGLSRPPSFRLMFDSNNWADVVTTLDEEPVFYEIIYVVKAKSASICVAQTDSGMSPFISALEVRRLSNMMYNALPTNHALFAITRAAFGSETTIRYPDDAYDRVWFKVPSAGAVTSDAPSIATGSSYNEPPEAVMRKAITGSNITFWIPNDTHFNVYMYLYFSEVISLSAAQRRSFQLYKHNLLMSQDPINPPYQSVLEVSWTNFFVSNGTELLLVPTADSTLPPIINAMEAYTLSGDLTEGTHPGDVQGLEMLKNAYSVLSNWTGDPCLPIFYQWGWIQCEASQQPPRVTALYLSSFNLNGPLPDFSTMDALTIIDLSNNSIYGNIPDFLGTSFPYLEKLDLSDNDFCGSIPESVKSVKDYRLRPGNPSIGKSCSSAGHGGNETDSDRKVKFRVRGRGGRTVRFGLEIGAAILVFIIVTVLGFCCRLWRKKKTGDQAGEEQGAKQEDHTQNSNAGAEESSPGQNRAAADGRRTD